MSFNYINKFLLLFSLLFIFCCQDIVSNNKSSDSKIINLQNNNKFKLDLSSNQPSNKKIIDYYTNHLTDINFTNKELKKIKINNFRKKNNDLPLNIINDKSNIFTLNFNNEIVKLNSETGKIEDTIKIQIESVRELVPISFSYVNGDFVIGFKSGQIIKLNNNGELIWNFNHENLLNTPIKIYSNFMVVLYSDHIIILSNNTGEILFEKKYNSSNIIQSTGGKITNFFNLIYFILPNSNIGSIDTFIFEDHISNFNNINLSTSLNNLNDKIYVYNSYLAYLDNNNILNTFDINKNIFILNDNRINNITSSTFFNNILITLSYQNINFYNILNGELIFEEKLEKIIRKDSKIINALLINKKIHIFFNNGKLIIFDKNYKIENLIDLKINNIIKIYSHNNKIFAVTDKGITYIY